MSKARRGRGEASIFKRTDGKWSAEISLGYDDKGRRRRGFVIKQPKTKAGRRTLTLPVSPSRFSPRTKARRCKPGCSPANFLYADRRIPR